MNDAQVEEQAVRLLHDPKWREVSDKAALFAFANCPQSGYHSTPENDAFIREYAGNRPLSFPLLQQAAAELKKAQVRGDIQRKRNAPESVEQIDQLDDQSVQSTYEGVMRERAKRLKAANGQTQYENPEVQLLALREDFEKNG